MNIKYVFPFTLAALLLHPKAISQTVETVGAGSYASYPPNNVGLVDGYFAAPYEWFKKAYPLLNLHDNHISERSQNRCINIHGYL